jgi:thymidylate kinase
MSDKPKLICITGPDGSGKTTQMIKIAEKLEHRGGLKVAAVTIWDLLLDPVSRNKLMFRGPSEVDGYLEILDPLARGLFLYHCFYQALELANRRKPDVCLLNAYWYKYYATEVAHGGDPEKLLHLAEIFPRPDVTVYLEVTPEKAFERKAELSGYESGFAKPRTKEAFVAFQEKAHAVLEELARKENWIRMSGTETIDQVTSGILEKLETGERV